MRLAPLLLHPDPAIRAQGRELRLAGEAGLTPAEREAAHAAEALAPLLYDGSEEGVPRAAWDTLRLVLAALPGMDLRPATLTPDAWTLWRGDEGTDLRVVEGRLYYERTLVRLSSPSAGLPALQLITHSRTARLPPAAGAFTVTYEAYDLPTVRPYASVDASGRLTIHAGSARLDDLQVVSAEESPAFDWTIEGRHA